MLETPKALSTYLNTALSGAALSCTADFFIKIIIREDSDSEKLDSENFKDITMDNQQETKYYN
jgi:hypothetical protein